VVIKIEGEVSADPHHTLEFDVGSGAGETADKAVNLRMALIETDVTLPHNEAERIRALLQDIHLQPEPTCPARAGYNREVWTGE
jgi:hypothetical protein